MVFSFFNNLSNNYPRSIFFIVGNELCERFSYHAIRAVAILYLVDRLKYDEHAATKIYHGYMSLCLFFTLFGAFVADGYIGKYRTILYLSIVHAVGNITLAVAATPLIGVETETARAFALLGLLLLAFGSGGIKPCVGSLGGDQFSLPQQAVQLASFFSVFYLIINVGSLTATYITPILRHDVQCFGELTCYSLAFGLPAVLMAIALVVFVAGKSKYVCNKPKGNVLLDITKCVSHAVRVKLKSQQKRDHWLDHAADKYDQTLISDIKDVLRFLPLLAPMPLFEAIFSQQGSKWLLQAKNMDGSFGWATIKPDQMHFINPFMVILFIPLFDYILYPLLARCRLLTTPMQKLCAGGIMAALAFVASAAVETKLEATSSVMPQAGLAQLRVFNGLSCDVNVTSSIPAVNGHIDALGAIQATDIPLIGSSEEDIRFVVNENCHVYASEIFLVEAFLQEEKSVSLFVTSVNGVPVASRIPDFDNVKKDVNGYPSLRVLHGDLPSEEMLVLSQEKFTQSVEFINNSISTVYTILKTGRLTAKLGDAQVSGDVDLGPAGVYTLILSNHNNAYVSSLITVTAPNSVHMLWQLPQYIIITVSEVMFFVTFLEFTYTQAPPSMKSFLAAMTYLTSALGNVIVIIIEEVKLVQDQAQEYLFFVILMTIDMIVFIVLAYRYKYRIPHEFNSQEKVEMAENKSVYGSFD